MPSPDVVLTGLSGRFPESESIEEFAEQLFAGVDLVTTDGRRWTPGLHGLPMRNGKLKDLARLDAKFFGVHEEQAHLMDPQLRMLLEVTHEAVIDAGINPSELRGSRTGVYVGVSSSETYQMWASGDPNDVNGYALTGSCLAMFPNRISYTFDFKGPSYAIDTSCSSSMFALTQAVKDIRAGDCDAAIVAGTNLCLNPATSLFFQQLRMLSPEGRCAAFDVSGSGYVRSEAVVAVLLQRRDAARRVYATVRGARAKNDGGKEQAITFPSADMQRQLAQETFREAGLRPQDVVYFEAHGTGTKVGDFQEAKAIAEFFCKDRQQPLLLGSVKSNMGHSEAASGLCSIAKIVIAIQSGVIPGNLHYQSPNPNIPALSDDRIQVVSRNMKWDGGLVAVNSFGFGGANAHVILEAERSSQMGKASARGLGSVPPRLILASGRSEEAVRVLLQHARTHRDNAELHALLHAVHALPIHGHAYRGYCLLNDPPQEEIVEIGGDVSGEARPVWFMFSGMGSQWPGMGRSLLALPAFAASVARSAQVLVPHGIDLLHLLTEADEEAFDVMNSIVSITAVQVALVDVLREVGITPDGVVGHSLGEVACGYADESLTAGQAVLCAYWIARSVVDAALPPGAMAVVGLGWEEVRRRCPPDVVPACHNAKENVTVSGPVQSIEKFVAELNAEGIFSSRINSFGVAFHSKYIAAAAALLRKRLEELIPNPKPRSTRWVSSSLSEQQRSSDLGKLNCADYHVNSMLSPVLLAPALAEVPARAVVVEVAPHALVATMLRRTLPHAIHAPLLRRGSADVARHLMATLGKLFMAGCQPQVSRLYPPVQWPVPRGTPSLASHVRWDHSVEWSVANFSTQQRSSENFIDYDLSRAESAFIAGHNIDGRILFPVSGYLTLVWHTMAKRHNKKPEETCIILENVLFRRATILSHEMPVRFLVNILDGSGQFEVCEGDGDMVVCGSTRLVVDRAAERVDPVQLSSLPMHTSTDADLLPLDTNDIYKDFRLRGYNYGGVFRGIRAFDPRTVSGWLAWNDNWISFMDTMLQFGLIETHTRELYQHTRLQRVVIDPLAQTEALAGSDGTLPVRMYKDKDVIMSGGVEIHGIKTKFTPRRVNPQPAPKLEKCVFVPYDNNLVTSTADMSLSEHDALTVSLQLVLENACSFEMRIMEAALGRSAELLLLPRALRLLEAEPQLRAVDCALAAGAATAKYANIQKLGVQVTNKDVWSDATGPDWHAVLAADVVSREPRLLAALAAAPAPRGALLLREPLHALDARATQAIAAAGLVVLSRQVAASCEYIVLGREATLPKMYAVLEVTSDSKYAWVSQLQAAMRQADAKDSRLYLWSREEDSGILGLGTCLRSEVGGHALRVYHVPGARVFAPDAPEYAAQVQKDLAVNVLRAGVWGCYRHLPLAERDEIPLLQMQHAYVNTMARGDLSSLRWIASDLRHATEQPLPVGTDLCRVHYAALNFRDVTLATGELPPDALPGKLTGQERILGLEFSGRSSRGTRVMGMVAAGGLATSVLCEESFLWHVPDAWSLEEAATVPVAYATAYYALAVRGRMQRGEAVLVHAGAGASGQAAIAIALHAGCTVFTTVGTPDQRAFLLDRFPELRPENVGNSHDTSFEQLVMQSTRGRGVDLVLNSLAHDKLLASVRCLAEGGRFLEIGKLDLSENTPLDISIFVKNITFTVIQLDALFDTGSVDVDKAALVRCINEGIANGAVRPLSATVFSNQQLEQAFRFMAGGEHNGKVVVRVREEGVAKLASCVPRTYMHAHKSYILVGGLDGFGLELGSWLVARGARHLVVVTRSGVRGGYQALCVRRWRRAGARVLLWAADASTPDGARRLLREATDLAPVAGVFNLAAVLRDNFFENQTEDDFCVVTKPKIDITRALDKATRELAPALEHFVVFSSVSCGRGNPGQTNYGLANSGMERVMEQRRADGLPGLAIQWGAIGDVGLVMSMASGLGGEEVEIAGTVPQRIASCLDALDSLLWRPHAVVACMVVADKRRRRLPNSATRDVVDSVANMLGIADPSKVAQTASLAELGLDSLMSTELMNTLERTHGVVLGERAVRALTFARLRELAGAGATCMPVADSRCQAHSATHDIVHSVANMLGIADPSKVAQTASLAELGLDSLMSTELMNTLERAHGVVLGEREVRALTFARLRELAGAGATCIKVADSRCQAHNATHDIVNSVANMLGITDPSKVAQSVSLAELGLDSLMSTELMNTLERAHGVVLGERAVRALTFARLRELAGAGDTCVVMAADKRSQAHSATHDIVNSVANMLGIADPSKVSQTASLAELGLDSLMSTELMNTLERAHGVVLGERAVRALTFARLRELAGAGATCMPVADSRCQAHSATHDIVHSVAKMLGIADPSKVSQTASLAELGLDSLMSTELMNTLERAHGVVLGERAVRALTFARLRELASAGRRQATEAEATTHQRGYLL